MSCFDIDVKGKTEVLEKRRRRTEFPQNRERARVAEE
jgi:hypothetical protein